jgi:hypothetical protein
MLNIQQYLRNGGTLESLATAPFYVTAKPHPRYSNLKLFKYDQILSDFSNPIVREARGIILDSANDWKVVAHPFDKFGNYGESYADPIDWSQAVIQEKKDGSLLFLWYYDNQWQVSTSGTPDASGEVNGYDITFARLFWETWDKACLTHGFSLLALDPQATYCFELCSPLNRIVVRHFDKSLTFLGCRDIESNTEFLPSIFNGPLTYLNVMEFPSIYNSMQDAIDHIKGANGLNIEGWVIVGSRKPNGSYNRVKLKCDSYVRYHRLRDSLSATPKNLVDIIRKNEGVEWLLAFPEYQKQYDTLKEKYMYLTEWEDIYFESYKEQANGDRKAFAALAKTTKVPGYYFSRLDGKCKGIREYLSNVPIDHLMALLYKE